MSFEKREHELHSRRRLRNVAVLIALLGLVAMLFAVTIVKMGAMAGNPWG